ncbi:MULTISPECIES: pyruvate formate-lyase-activating protein [Lacrimispora]|uniref:pyruvate formate-lyase-activating protein n=1 Tax=Lacrimispora TaxID=2719231 RepID=UPI000BE43138|nr:pyruvate formate-lyase-activating protein [Lacrimispora amygdalina]MDK2966765.1 pyruvate formate lyase activating enzyme [Lacrimispora sp.]
MTGRIHSIESFGTVDGPGVRMVVFFQGCPMRCQYCHNPDTWELAGGSLMTVEELLKQFESSRHFYRGGGITATGGEPLMQLDFLTELFEAARKRDIHTCLDTSGVTFNRSNEEYRKKIDRLLASTSLVMLDIKQINDIRHKPLTGHSNAPILNFARYLDEKEIPVWIRHVVVPGITDEAPDLYHLGRFIGQLKNVKALDVLPYHDMGKVKYESMGMDYPLKGVPPLSKEDAISAKKIILTGIRDARSGEPDPYCS